MGHRGQWEVIPGWGVRNVFTHVTVEMRVTGLEPSERYGFLFRVCDLLNTQARQTIWKRLGQPANMCGEAEVCPDCGRHHFGYYGCKTAEHGKP